jgi:DNA-binding XRE family transcriptional regulator
LELPFNIELGNATDLIPLNVALMLYATCMSRNPEEPVYNRIEEARAASGLSRQDLADKVGVHYQTIGYLEREEYSPSLVLAIRIAKTLNKEVSDLFSLTPFKKGK